MRIKVQVLKDIFSSFCGKIGFLPDELRHVGINVSGADLCANINR